MIKLLRSCPVSSVVDTDPQWFGSSGSGSLLELRIRIQKHGKLNQISRLQKRLLYLGMACFMTYCSSYTHSLFSCKNSTFRDAKAWPGSEARSACISIGLACSDPEPRRGKKLNLDQHWIQCESTSLPRGAQQCVWRLESNTGYQVKSLKWKMQEMWAVSKKHTKNTELNLDGEKIGAKMEV